ncbi:MULTISPECIES: hypothetical protein [Legionella]|uniref:Uncharacterized protein n=1 Tax=Legionella drozanskii LLAP-1 TaxID=1212489 RepID=A0A0W0T0Y0_9GAMM|nr:MULTISPECIES: hypothetical protein [Legionella]KTC89250.1 hypothetical protein Ldro_0739 [Legionella drozanskii LLAP-1]PJE13400.1 MAG: hypothetical protein CK430_06490 [Legionella sp.]
MFFFTRLQTPRFSSTDYEKLIERMLVDAAILEGSSHKYNALLKLKGHVAKMAASLHQLKGLSSSATIEPLEKCIQQAIFNTIDNKKTDHNEIKNRLAHLKEDLNSEEGRKIISGLFMFTNGLLTTVSAVGIIIFGAAMTTGPVGMALLALTMAIVSALVLMIAAYSLYVDGRNLFDKQIKEIESGIDFLIEEYTELQAGNAEELDNMGRVYN